MSKRKIIAERIEQRANDKGISEPQVRVRPILDVYTEEETGWLFKIWARDDKGNKYGFEFVHDPEDEGDVQTLDSIVEDALNKIREAMEE